jgi:hypothetical protein
MVSPNVNKILEAAQVLNDAERQELRRLLDHRTTAASPPTKREQLRQALVVRGLLEARAPHGKDIERFNRWQPIAIHGKPVSETIIEERR